MELSGKGQLLSRHTKVVHHSHGCLKAGLMDEEVLDCCYDKMYPNILSGRNISDAPQSKVVLCYNKQ